MPGLPILLNLFAVLLAVAGAWSILFEGRRKSVPLWRLLLPAVLVSLCALALLAGLSGRGRGILVVAFLIGIPAGSARAFWLRMRFDHAAKLVRLSPVRDGLWVAAEAVLFATIAMVVTFRSPGGAASSPLFAAGATFCAGYLGARALVTHSRSRKAIHIDLR